MPKLKDFVPDVVKSQLRLIAARLRYPDCFVGSPWIGQGVVLGRGCSISRGVELGAGVRIGDYSYVNCGAMVCSGEIGRFCSIGPNALIGMASHPTNYLSTSPLLYGSRNILGMPNSWRDLPAPPVLGSDVWIGANAFVRQGVHVGHGAVIGASAVVTHDVPEYSVVAGAPARILRFRFRPEIVRNLLEARWWELDVEELKRFSRSFSEPLDRELTIARTGHRRADEAAAVGGLG